MKIGFVQDEDNEPTLTEMGYAEAGTSENDGSWFEWGWRVFLDFCLVYGLLAIVNDFIDYLREF